MNQLSYLKRDQMLCSNSCLVAKLFNEMYGKVVLYDTDEDFYILQILKVQLLKQIVCHVVCQVVQHIPYCVLKQRRFVTAKIK